MPIGPSNATQNFQHYMDEELCELDFINTYIDDLLIALRDQHLQLLPMVLNRLDYVAS